jgi:HK97 gp10 family phage protein
MKGGNNFIGTMREVEAAARKLSWLSKSFDAAERRKILKGAARKVREAARNKVAVSLAAHKRYKGGRLVATYLPGNLKASIQVLPLRKTAAVFVGAKLTKSGASGEFGPGAKTDGYYGAWVEYGAQIGSTHVPARPFMRPAADETRAEAQAYIGKQIQKRLDAVLKQLASK